MITYVTQTLNGLGTALRSLKKSILPQLSKLVHHLIAQLALTLVSDETVVRCLIPSRLSEMCQLRYVAE